MKKLISVVVSVVLTLTLSPAPANAAKCSRSDLQDLASIKIRTYTSELNGDVEYSLKRIKKASQTTRNSSLKRLYSNLYSSLDRNGFSNKTRKLIGQLDNKLIYERC